MQRHHSVFPILLFAALASSPGTHASAQVLSVYTVTSFDFPLGTISAWTGVYLEYGAAYFYEVCTTLVLGELNGKTWSHLADRSFCTNGSRQEGWPTSVWLPDVPVGPEREYVATGSPSLTLTTQVDPKSREARRCQYPASCWYDPFNIGDEPAVVTHPSEPGSPMRSWFPQQSRNRPCPGGCSATGH